ncbi:ImmA/IrrE family metallo-endopeptidase [Glutamicibacter sp. X7]
MLHQSTHKPRIAPATIIWERPNPTMPAATDGERIWIDPDLSRAEIRCALMHEMFHVSSGHRGCQPPAVEREVCLEVARILVSFNDLRRVAGWATCPADMAEELGVTEHVVIDRLQTLDGDQIQQLWPPSDHVA